jgi:hypothetical protein
LLRPLDPSLAAAVTQVQLRGERDAIREVTVQQRDGDHSLMRITPRE